MLLKRFIANAALSASRGIATKALISGATAHDIGSKKFFSPINQNITIDMVNENIAAALREDFGGDSAEVLSGPLKELREKGKEWLLSREIWDREELSNYFDEAILNMPGQFVCYMGGKSTGKSAFFTSLTQRTFPKVQGKPSPLVVRVNLRETTDIKKALIEALVDHPQLFTFGERLFDKWGDLIQPLSKYLTPLTGIPSTVISAPLELVNSFYEQSRAELKKASLGKLITKLVSKDYVLTIVIDEANLAFTKESSSFNKVAAEESFNTLTHLTKESAKINVVLVSSEHIFPFRLSEDMDVKTNNFSKFVYAGEIPPDKMYELLTAKWGLGPNLALAMVDAFGGHIWDCLNAMPELVVKGCNFSAKRVWGTSVGDVGKCLDWAEEKGKVSEMRTALENLSRDGFHPVKKLNDPVARELSKHNVGGVVMSDNLVIGLPDSVWNVHKTKYGMVPFKQSTRILIADELTLNDRDHQ